MAFSIKQFKDRFIGRPGTLTALDTLASSPSAEQSLEERLNWLVDVVQWIRRPGGIESTVAVADSEIAPPNVSLQSGRLRRFLDILDRNLEWKLNVARTLRSIIAETRAVALFSETGLPRQFGLLTEISERLARKFLPAPPGSAELGVLFDRLFPYAGDEAWILSVDDAAVQRFEALLNYGVRGDEKDWNKLAEELEDALAYLAAQIRVIGCSASVRQRVKHKNLRELAFFKLGVSLTAVFAARDRGDAEATAAELNYLRSLMDACDRARLEALENLEKSGVSTDVVYHLAFIDASLQRFQDLLDMAFDPAAGMRRRVEFLALLARENRARESVMDLLRKTCHLMTRKMVERTGELGAHYIARTRQEYAAMLKSAAGGGVIMAFTAWMKTILLSWGLAGLLEGIAASLNYSIGFVAIQLTGSTLATKQPANTAPALAARMNSVRDPAAMESLVDEIVFLVRSQIASIVGNLALIVPMMLALHLVVFWVTGAPILSPTRAEATMKSISIIGPSLLYAGFTGVLLWASALVAAWGGNWFARHQMGEALATDKRLIRVLGPSRAGRFARFWSRQTAGLCGNISFGFMLGIIPEVAKFAGIPLDIRHVTLSAGFLTASVATLGPAALSSSAFILGVFGVLGIGFMNLTVSFYLAMFVATRACAIQPPERLAIYRAVIRRAARHPFSFIWPTTDSVVVAPSSA